MSCFLERHALFLNASENRIYIQPGAWESRDMLARDGRHSPATLKQIYHRGNVAKMHTEQQPEGKLLLWGAPRGVSVFL